MFGGGKGSKPPTAGEAIQKLRETEEMLIKKQDFLEKKIQDELKVAKQNGTKNKRGMYYCHALFFSFFERSNVNVGLSISYVLFWDTVEHHFPQFLNNGHCLHYYYY